MNKISLAWATCLVFSLVSGLPVQAQTAYAPPAPVYTQQQLDQMLAPVALYPDSLLAQVLMASTYPLEVVQAQRFVEARPGLQGDGLARAVAPMPWDPSVKALVQFPSVLAMLNDRLDWTQQLGQAFLGQQAPVMDTVQNLRERARIAGTLESSPQQRVVVQDEMIEIVPVNPQVVYVPYYNPTVVYGSWWWPSAPPVVWAPPPRYRPPSYEPGFSASISFGVGIGVMRAVFGEARPDWRQRQVLVTQTRINNVTNVNNTNIIHQRYVNNVTVNRNVTMNQRPVVWHHDPRYAGGRYAQPSAPAVAPPPGHHAPAVRPLPVVDNVQQRLAQQDQFRQRQAVEQQRQREQQANDQQRQREQMIRDQQHQREQQAQEQRQRQQAEQRQWQQHQQGQQQRQQQREQQMREQQMRQQQMMNQQREQQHRQMEQARQQQQQQHEVAQREQHQQQTRQHEAHPRRDDRRDERS